MPFVSTLEGKKRIGGKHDELRGVVEINHRTVTAVICTVRVWDKATDKATHNVRGCAI